MSFPRKRESSNSLRTSLDSLRTTLGSGPGSSPGQALRRNDNLNMQQFDCPFCGPRDQSEYTYGREVAPIPQLDAPRADWQRYVFERDNPCGAHVEWWHHNLGCRQWLVITRDTLTHAVIAIAPARDARAGESVESRAGASVASSGPASQ